MDVNVRNYTIYYLEDDLSIIQSINMLTGKKKQVNLIFTFEFFDS